MIVDDQERIHKRSIMRIAQMKRRYDTSRSVVKSKIVNHYFFVEDKPTFKLNSGITTRYYFDTRHMMLNWMHTRDVASLFRYKILLDAFEDDIEPINLMVGGLETGAILLTMSILNSMAIGGFYVRKQLKDHGNQKLVVTPKDLNGKNIIIIDDIMTSGESIFQAIGSVAAYYPNCKIWKIYTLIDRSRELDFDPFDKYWNDRLGENDTGFFSVFDSEEDFIKLLDEDKHKINYKKSKI